MKQQINNNIKFNKLIKLKNILMKKNVFILSKYIKKELKKNNIINGMCYGSKSYYSKTYQFNKITFNSSIYIKNGNKNKMIKIFYGDIDLTINGKKLKEIAYKHKIKMYVVHEGFSGNYQNLKLFEVWNTEQYIPTLTKKKIKYLKKERKVISKLMEIQEKIKLKEDIYFNNLIPLKYLEKKEKINFIPFSHRVNNKKELIKKELKVPFDLLKQKLIIEFEKELKKICGMYSKENKKNEEYILDFEELFELKKKYSAVNILEQYILKELSNELKKITDINKEQLLDWSKIWVTRKTQLKINKYQRKQQKIFLKIMKKYNFLLNKEIKEEKKELKDYKKWYSGFAILTEEYLNNLEEKINIKEYNKNNIIILNNCIKNIPKNLKKYMK